MDATLPHLKYIKSKEFHVVYMTAKEEIGSQIEIDQSLAFLSSGTVEAVEADSVENAVDKIEMLEKVNFVRDTLLIKMDYMETEKKANFGKSVKNLREYLKSQGLGTLKPTKAFLKLITIARSSDKEDILKALTQKKNKDIL